MCALVASSYIATAGGTATRNGDALIFPFDGRVQALTLYVRLVESGGAARTAGDALVRIGGNEAAGDAFFSLDTGGTNYRVLYDNGNLQREASVATAPTIGDGVELLAQLSDEGHVTLEQSIDGAASTSASQTLDTARPQKWSTAELAITSRNGSSRHSVGRIRNIVATRGVQSMATMRRLAGVM